MAGTPEMLAPVGAEHGRGYAVASLVLGISSLVFSWLPLLALPSAIVGLVLSVKGRRLGPYTGMSTAGLVLSLIGIILAVANTALLAVMLASGRHMPWTQT